MSDPTPNPLSRLIEEEDASAAIEFMVLIPVYILMLTGLFMFGNLVLARYTLVHGVRYVAWHPDTNNLNNGFPAISPYPGTLQISGSKGADYKPSSSDLEPKDADERKRMGDEGGYGAAKSESAKIAEAVFNNKGGQTQMYLAKAEGSFDYQGVIVGGLDVKQSGAKAVVYLTRNYARKEYDKGSDHPAAEWGGSVIKPKSNNKEAILSPKFQRHFSKEDGVWDPDARIDGSWQAELQFYTGETKVE